MERRPRKSFNQRPLRFRFIKGKIADKNQYQQKSDYMREKEDKNLLFTYRISSVAD